MSVVLLVGKLVLLGEVVSSYLAPMRYHDGAPLIDDVGSLHRQADCLERSRLLSFGSEKSETGGNEC